MPRPASLACLPACLSAIVLLALGGCAVQPYEPRPIDVATAQAAWLAASPDDETSQAALAAQGIDTSRWPLAAWDLEALTALALARHPDLAVARAELRQAQAAQATALKRAGRNAEITAEHHSDTADGRSPWTLGVVFDGVLSGAAQRSARGDEAEALATEAALAAAQAVWQLRQRVRGAHRDLYFAQQSVEAAREVQQRRAELATSAQTRLARGAADAREALLALTAEADARQQVAQSQDHLHRARLALAAALALPAERVVAMPLRFDGLSRDPPAAPAADLQRQALLNRLDVRAALARYAAADAALRLELARQWPDLVLKPGYAWDQGDNRWSLGLAISWPPGGRNQAPIEQARARRETEAARCTAVQAAAIVSLQAAAQAADAARTQRDAASEHLRQSRQLGLRTRQRLAAGDADRPEALTAALAEAEANKRWGEAQAALWAARGTLEDAVQRPLDLATLSGQAGVAAPLAMKHQGL